MSSLRQKVTTYFRQLSFIAEPRDSPKSSRKTEDDNNFIIKYLEGRMDHIFTPAPEIFNGQSPTDMPDMKIAAYPTGPNTITAACTGPDDGLTGIKRSKLHLNANYADDIDFIDTTQENDCYEVRKSISNNIPTNTIVTSNSTRGHNKFQRYGSSRRLSAVGSTSNTNDQNANRTGSGMRSRKNSKSSLHSMTQGHNKDVSTSAKIQQQKNEENLNKSTTIVVSMVSTKPKDDSADAVNDQNNKNLLNTATEGSFAQTKDIKDSIAAENISDLSAVKLLDDSTERLLREAVTSQTSSSALMEDTVAGVSNWKMDDDSAYGIAVSLYENNMLTKEPVGSPIADCYGIVVRDNVAVMALADGVNWGDGARLAARSAVHGCLDYLDRAIFGLAQECMATSTQDVFVSLLRSLWEGHGCILEVGGALSTLTIAVVLPLAKNLDNMDQETAEGEDCEKYVVCACNVGDSLGYVYSKKHGVRELTMASHDIVSMRDMRDALGALGPADGNKPELSNLTFSMTIIDSGDIVFLTSDGVSDNFDPVVGKFAEAWTTNVQPMSTSVTGHLASKRKNRSSSALHGRLQGTTKLLPIPVRPPRTKKTSASDLQVPANRPKYMRSHTVIEAKLPARNVPYEPANYGVKIPKSAAGLPLVTGPQRHSLTLHRLEDLLSYGINGTFSPCSSARRLCHLLIDFVRMITSARRKTLEQRELFYKISIGADGKKREMEMNRMQHRSARKRVIESPAFAALPGKLDHASVVAFTAGSNKFVENKTNAQIEATTNGLVVSGGQLQSKEFHETNF